MKSIYEFHNFHKIYQAYMQSLSIVYSDCFTMYLLLLFINRSRFSAGKKEKKMLFLREMRPYKLELSEKTTSYFPRLRQQILFLYFYHSFFRDYVNRFYFYTFTIHFPRLRQQILFLYFHFHFPRSNVEVNTFKYYEVYCVTGRKNAVLFWYINPNK